MIYFKKPYRILHNLNEMLRSSIFQILCLVCGQLLVVATCPADNPTLVNLNVDPLLQPETTGRTPAAVSSNTTTLLFPSDDTRGSWPWGDIQVRSTTVPYASMSFRYYEGGDPVHSDYVSNLKVCLQRQADYAKSFIRPGELPDNSDILKCGYVVVAIYPSKAHTSAAIIQETVLKLRGLVVHWGSVKTSAIEIHSDYASFWPDALITICITR